MLVLVAVAAAAAVVVVDMTRSGRDAVATRTTDHTVAPPVPAPPVTDPQAKAGVMDAYTQSFKGIVEVGKDSSPNPDDPRLSEHTTGTALIAEQRSLADNKSKGLIYFGDVETHPTVIDLTATTATVIDCSYDRTGLMEARTGKVVVDAGPPTAGASTATLVLEVGVWKVNHFTDEKRTCVPPAT